MITILFLISERWNVPFVSPCKSHSTRRGFVGCWEKFDDFLCLYGFAELDASFIQARHQLLLVTMYLHRWFVSIMEFVQFLIRASVHFSCSCNCFVFLAAFVVTWISNVQGLKKALVRQCRHIWNILEKVSYISMF